MRQIIKGADIWYEKTKGIGAYKKLETNGWFGNDDGGTYYALHADTSKRSIEVILTKEAIKKICAIVGLKVTERGQK